MAQVNRLIGGTLVIFACAFPIAHTQSTSSPAVTVQSPIDRWQAFIAEASRRFGIPQAWIRAVMRVESDGQPILDGQPITSRAGAMGLMQVMPHTYDELRRQYGLGGDPYDPHDNILAGTAYLRELYLHYGYPNLFAAYNAGPAKFDMHLFNGQPLPDETLAYLAALDQPSLEPQLPSLAPSGGLFFALHTGDDASLNATTAASANSLFVPLMTGSKSGP